MKSNKITVGVALILGGAMGSGAAWAAPPPGKGKPPVETQNNLSYPAAFTGPAPVFPLLPGEYALGATFPVGLSYGCNVPETIGTTTYPNTSCVNDAGVPMTPAECVAPGGKCEGLAESDLEPIYWQKNADNLWQAGYVAGLGTAIAEYLDWADNLESVSWKTTSIIRVETNAFTSAAAVRFDMWHVFGQGTNELWGVHATTADLPYVFEAWPYAVINTADARLNIAKLTNGPATCPTSGPAVSPFNPTWSNGWVGTWLLRDVAYTAELNIKGSYVFGYNWNLKKDVVPPEVGKAGWWRLTFYTTEGSVDFTAFDTSDPSRLAPPTSDLVPAPILAAAEEGDTGPLYVPVVDTVNNLTYIDICINEGNSRGGGGGGGQGNHP